MKVRKSCIRRLSDLWRRNSFLSCQHSLHLMKATGPAKGVYIIYVRPPVPNCVVGNEIELLTNIYNHDELVVKECGGLVTLNVHITPRTADDTDQQFVYVNVTMELNKEYPMLPPVTKITSSRGLSDAHISSIISDVQLMGDNRLGGPMLFDLLEHVRDCLTDQNKPCGSCSICLCVFEEEDKFTKTQCYHYFHVNCFARYVYHVENDDNHDNVDGIPGQPHTSNAEPNCVKCPVCRVSLHDNSSCFHAISDVTVTSSPDDKDIQYRPSKDDIQRMKKWEWLMEKQRSQGGIIDHSTDPHLVDWDWTPTPVTVATDNTAVNTLVSATKETTSNPVVMSTMPKSTRGSTSNTTHHRPRTQYYYHKKTRHKHY